MRHRRVLQIITITITTVILSASCGAIDRTDTTSAAAPAREATQVGAETSDERCAGLGDAFQLDAPGTYAAFAMRSGQLLSTEVRGSHGALLTTSHSAAVTTAPVDIATGLRFGIAPPQVFEVESAVTIHVEDNTFPYELIVVRVSGPRGFSGMNLHPPVEHIVNESGSCLLGDLRETFKIHTDGVYSDTGARQVFVVSSPDRLITS